MPEGAGASGGLTGNASSQVFSGEIFKAPSVIPEQAATAGPVGAGVKVGRDLTSVDNISPEDTLLGVIKQTDGGVDAGFQALANRDISWS